jgi:hypothetical protein
MRKYRMASAMLCFVSLLAALSVSAQQCEAVLTETGRNYMSQITINDQKAWYYKNICNSSSTNIGASGTYSNFAQDMLSQANSKFGFNYNNVATYCSTEASNFQSYVYANTQTSTVMASSTEAWLKCIELSHKGILVTPHLGKETVTFALKRNGATNGILNGVVASNNTFSCKATIKDRRGKNTEADLRDNSIGRNFRMADVDTMTVICTRNPLTDSAQATYYAGGSISLVTSEGPLTVEIPADTMGKEAWASEVQAVMKGHDALLTNHSSALAALDIFAHSPHRIELFVPDGTSTLSGATIANGYGGKMMAGPNGGGFYGADQEAPCDPTMVVVAVKGGGSAGQIAIRCAVLRMVP